ncbi:hypothetical protein [Ferrimonas senticii]|uniref:hypothetical protein n=1 Tax=Ferrimonas senticii TaxID=394566 RepID=UPI0012ECB71D|nr:hypothetical protein [Ferrimonas senticii]
MEAKHMVVLVLVFGFLALAVWTDYRKDMMKLKTGRTNWFDRMFGVGSASGDDGMGELMGEGSSKLRDEVAELRAQNQKLAERVEVLERIVTDSQYELKQQFQKLG